MGMFSTVSNLIARAVLTALNTGDKCQGASLELIGGETKENVEHIEPYGFTSAAQNDAEAIVLFPSGDRSHGVVIAVADRRYRLKGLKRGEVALYTDEGDSIVLKRGRVTEINTDQLVVNAKTKITFNTPLIEASGDYKGAGEVSDGVGSMSQIRTTYNGHTHIGNGAGNQTGGPSASMGK
ncbi:Prophage baseplate assembly protein V [Pantoea agglomerans 299R]|nr:phage baseplate assembly protein V [Pantoea agglomerans]ELP25057.1 Prophage baseplate assembly protein V [Pantoea agglomerans 299R]ELP25942.1 Prophage baseplate assembly protein V [Pantoea agglomerans 299R]